MRRQNWLTWLPPGDAARSEEIRDMKLKGGGSCNDVSIELIPHTSAQHNSVHILYLTTLKVESFAGRKFISTIFSEIFEKLKVKLFSKMEYLKTV